MEIYETEYFKLTAPENPLITREDGGHLKIKPKQDIKPIIDRTGLSPKQATDVMRLTMLAGESFVVGMRKRGIDIVRINYQDNGNWAFRPERIARGDKPHFHINLFGRCIGKRNFPEALVFPPRNSGFYDDFKSLNADDIVEIQKQISILEKNEKYKLSNWGL